jgi:integrase
MQRRRIPSYRCYKPKNLGLVVLDGKQHYLGRYGSPESLAEYNRLIQEWLARTPDLPVVGPSPTQPTIDELILAFWRHAEGHYRKPDGSPSGELDNLRAALRPLRRLYGHTPAREFGPAGLRAVRAEMIAAGLGRTTVNARINRLRRVFKWAASVELISAAIVQALQTVPGLQRGRSQVKEPAGIRPVPVEQVEAALPFMPRPVAAMVRLQLLTGCRTGEVLTMRGCDLRPGDPTWEYRPSSHKNAWRGQERVIPLGPKAQAIAKEFLKPDLDAYLFSPRDHVAELHARRRASRRSRPTPSELGKRVADVGRGHARRYDRRSYRQAIIRACDKAFPHPTLAVIARKDLTPEQREEIRSWRRAHRWTPLQLRHAAATMIRAKYGLEAAQTILGHARADVTQVYAERDLSKAHAIMAEVG